MPTSLIQPLQPINDPRAIGWYDTKIDRYETGKNTIVNRVVLPPDFMAANDMPQLPTTVPAIDLDQRIGLGVGSQVLTDGRADSSRVISPTSRILAAAPKIGQQQSTQHVVTENGFRVQSKSVN